MESEEPFIDVPENPTDFTDLPEKDLSRFKNDLQEMGVLGESKLDFIRKNEQENGKLAAGFIYKVLTGQITEEQIKNNELRDDELSWYKELKEGEIDTGMIFSVKAGSGSIDTLDKYGKVIIDEISQDVNRFTKGKTKRAITSRIDKVKEAVGLRKKPRLFIKESDFTPEKVSRVEFASRRDRPFTETRVAQLLYNLEEVGIHAFFDSGDPTFPKRKEALEFARKALELTGYLDEHPDFRESINLKAEVIGKSNLVQ